MEKIINIFGDSIAWGACDNELGGWANRLRNDLAKRPADYLEVYNLGISGDNSDKLLKRFTAENEIREPDTIIIAVGINDSLYIESQNNPRIPLARFENNLMEIMRQAKKFTKEIIFVGLTSVDESKVAPTIWESNKYYDNESISIYNAKIKEICEKNNLAFIEMLDLLKNEDLEDGLHPNTAGHEKMFLRIKDFLVDKKII
ncbi:MAG: GDSL-type esterase/lipase family protein [Parcubacteria group bacterium]|jgi:lysophospholipase L1-like esterase